MSEAPSGHDALAAEQERAAEEERAAEHERAAEQEHAAAAEAGAIGGATPEYGEADPATRPLDEAGQGEAEGFEQAEDELIRSASHEDNLGTPAADAFPAEERSGATYGEADEVRASEVLDDPDEDPEGADSATR